MIDGSNLNKTIVITGCTSGIGLALLKEVARTNVVFAGYRNENYVEELSEISQNVIPFYIDMANKNSISQACAFIKSKTKKIDTVFNVAGCVVAGAIENIELDAIREQFEVNTFSHLDFTKQLLALMGEGGKIINISSMSSFGIFPFIAPYGASKRALDILFNSMLLETHKNIQIVSIKLGSVATPIWNKSIENNKSSIENSIGFEDEMKYLIKNAQKNEFMGANLDNVIKKLVEIGDSAKVKSSYTIGKDAKFAEILSKLPQDWINFLVKQSLKLKIRRMK
ncbi:MAG: SDR family NAD(P)-dependent oxidoreductase [Candidatus Gastranaerophilales bacterium]